MSRKEIERICDALVLEFTTMAVTELGARLTPAQIQRFRVRATLALELVARAPREAREGPWKDEDTNPGRPSAFPSKRG